MHRYILRAAKNVKESCFFHVPRQNRTKALINRKVANGQRLISTEYDRQTAFGQPVHRTHPHLIQANEVTPGITAMEYDLRRTKLISRLPPGSVVLVVGSGTRYMRGVAFHEFRQNANMFYLTGIAEPDTAMILKTDNSNKGYSMHLFMQPKDEFDEMWYGYRSGLAAATHLFGGDEVDDINKFSRVARTMLDSAKHIYFDKTAGGDLAGSCHVEIADVIGARKCVALSPLIHKLRIIKSEAEISLLRRAGQISGRVYNEAMKKEWTNEADLQAELRYGWTKHGAEREAYVPVVAGGDRAACIHYTQNNRLIGQGEMVLVDAGAEVGGYLTDISRAWPASGKFSEPQKDLYQAVLNVEKACIKMCTQDSAHSIQTIHMESVELMKIELRNLGFSLVEGDVERYLYPHRVGHHIGLEIHDCSSLGGFESLRENQTITIEPGCYVPYDDQWPKHFQGLALRVEDSIAVGKEVPTILSVEAVKEIVDIEALRA